MFDKLIVSEPEGAEFKSRRSYFAVSSLVVGLLFTVAVVISIFASDYRLGADSFELVEMLAPVEPVRTEPEPPRTQPKTLPTDSSPSTNAIPMRKVSMANINDTPLKDTPISVTPNNQPSVPLGRYEIGDRNSDPAIVAGSGRETEAGTGLEPGGIAASAPVAETRPIPQPPPVTEPPPAKPPVTKTLGVVNGLATSLPKPAYPAAAIAVNVQGKVDVQVLIDESGRVVSAKAVGGHALLRGAAVAAAKSARFTPTLFSKVPVKVTGVIVYNFTRG